ncbi:hypothetical protein PO909_010117, partial [Leuciscus waleckii]
ARANLSRGIRKAKKQYGRRVAYNFRDSRDTSELNNFFARFEAYNTTPAQKIPPPYDDQALCLSPANAVEKRHKMNARKAAGPDNIPGRVLKDCAGELKNVFTDIFNISLSQAVPTCLKATAIIPVPKKPSPSVFNDIMLQWYRLHLPCQCCSDHSPGCSGTGERFHFLKEQHGCFCVFFKMSFRPCVSGCGRSLSPSDGHDCCVTCFGVQHADAAFVDGSCSHSGNMTVSVLRSRLAFVREGAVPISTPHPRLLCGMGDWRSVMEFPPSNHSLWAPYSSITPMPVEPPVESTSLSVMDRLDVSLTAPLEDRMSIATLEGELTFGDGLNSAVLSPLGSVTLPEPDPQLSAMLKRAAEAVGLEWNPPPCPAQSRLDDWYLGAGRAGSQPAAPVPFFPEVHGELTRSWTAPFTAGSDLVSSSPLTTLEGGAVKGYEAIPPVERSVVAHLCPTAAADRVEDLRFPPQACGRSSVLTDRAYRACGQAASSLHALALLQVYQIRALSDMHEGSLGRALNSELRTATDLALRSTSVAACAVGLAMFILVVQERHSWLNLVDLSDADKVRFLDSPLSQVRRRGRELHPTDLYRPGAVGGNPTHPALAARCCHHPTACGRSTACSSPRASPCRRFRSLWPTAAAFT